MNRDLYDDWSQPWEEPSVNGERQPLSLTYSLKEKKTQCLYLLPVLMISRWLNSTLLLVLPHHHLGLGTSGAVLPGLDLCLLPPWPGVHIHLCELPWTPCQLLSRLGAWVEWSAEVCTSCPPQCFPSELIFPYRQCIHGGCVCNTSLRES